jgi:hypothetical protein
VNAYSDITISMWSCVGLCAFAALFMYVYMQLALKYAERIAKTHQDLSKEHFDFYDRLFKLRESTLKEMLDSWKGHYNKFITHTYVDFLDQAYAGKFGEKRGWVFKLPADIGDTVDLEIYYTSDEIKEIHKARDLYGEDQRLSSLDKRLGL